MDIMVWLRWLGFGKSRRPSAKIAGLALAPPLKAWAEQPTKVSRIAILHPSRPVTQITETSSVRDWREFFGELRRLGYIEVQNIVVERYSGERRTDNYPALVQSVVSRNPDFVRGLNAIGKARQRSDFCNADCCGQNGRSD